MSAAWVHMMKEVCPEYENLNAAIDRGPSFIAKIISQEKQWILSIEEIWHTGYCSLLPIPIMLDNVIVWVEKKLEKHKKCKRTSWNTWKFSSRKDAEIFQTLFYLSWAQSSIR